MPSPERPRGLFTPRALRLLALLWLLALAAIVLIGCGGGGGGDDPDVMTPRVNCASTQRPRGARVQ